MPDWHLVGDLTDNSVNPNNLPAEVAARISSDAQEAAERQAADVEQTAMLAVEAYNRSLADTAQAAELAAEVASRTATSGYTHLQTEPQTIWLITHNLGFDPGGISVFSSGFQMDEFSTHYVIPGKTLVLAFDIPLAGAANLS
jgi:hypothetical protein